MAHWCEQYIGQPYVHGESDCARLVCQVRREVFGQPVPDGAEVERAASRLGRTLQMHDGVSVFGQRVSSCNGSNPVQAGRVARYASCKSCAAVRIRSSGKSA